MHQPPFLLLSPELILLVCEKLQLTDLKQLRLSCKAISRITDSLVFRTLCVSAKGASPEEAISYLQSLGQSPARSITREVIIRDLSSLSSSDNIRLPWASTTERDIREKIKDALKSLAGVHHVTWHPNEKDSIWLQKYIWRVIKSFSTMRHLSIHPNSLKFLPNFDTLTYLDSISINASTCSETSWIYTRLSKLYASSSTLTSISIWDRPGRAFLTKANQIFSKRSMHASPSGIRRLSLHDCFISIDKLTLPHLRHLTSLELHCVNHRYSDLESTCCGDPRDIWSTFTGSGIRLEELVHNSTPPSLIDYLSTYSGLKKLNLLVSPFRDSSLSNKSATRFFAAVLPRHLSTLENLSLEACYEGQWCYTMRNAALITQCTKLNHLLMSLISSRTPSLHGLDEDDIDEDGEVDRSDFRRNVVKHLFDTIIHLPLLRRLSLLPTYPEFSRGSSCGTRRWEHHHLSNVEIKENVMNYRPPLSCRYIPEVNVGETTFAVVRDPDGQLRYEARS